MNFPLRGTQQHGKETQNRMSEAGTAREFEIRDEVLAPSVRFHGDEFKAAREHLLKNLLGDSAFRNARPAV